MGKIVVFENISLDGVTQDPTGEEGLSADNWTSSLTKADKDVWEDLLLDNPDYRRVVTRAMDADERPHDREEVSTRG